MTRRTATEARAGDFDPPFYRMYLRCSTQSNQHSLLVALEQEGNNEVFYAAPAFNTRAELNDAYSKGQVWNRSFQLKPSQIGLLSEDDHHVAFQFPGRWKSYSEEVRGREGETTDPRNIIAHLERELRGKQPPSLSARLGDLDQKMLRIVPEQRAEVAEWHGVDIGQLEVDLTPLRRVSYLARHFLTVNSSSQPKK